MVTIKVMEILGGRAALFEHEQVADGQTWTSSACWHTRKKARRGIGSSANSLAGLGPQFVRAGRGSSISFLSPSYWTLHCLDSSKCFINHLILWAIFIPFALAVSNAPTTALAEAKSCPQTQMLSAPNTNQNLLRFSARVAHFSRSR